MESTMSDQSSYDEAEAPDFSQFHSPAERAEAALQYANQMRLAADQAMLQGGAHAYDHAGEAPARHPGEEGLEAFDTRLRTRGGSREMASCEVTNRLVAAAIRGDKRVLIDNESWLKSAAERGS